MDADGALVSPSKLSGGSGSGSGGSGGAAGDGGDGGASDGGTAGAGGASDGGGDDRQLLRELRGELPTYRECREGRRIALQASPMRMRRGRRTAGGNY
jgi:hypothetical protein